MAQPAERSGALDQGRGAFRQACGFQRGIQGVLDDRPGGAEGVRADAEDHGVARAQHAGGVGEHVGPALEHEGDDAEGGGELLDAPAVVLDTIDHPAAAGRRGGPAFEALNHAAAHLVVGDQARGRAAGGVSLVDVGGVGGGDGRPSGLVGKTTGEGFEETGDLLVRHPGHSAEGLVGAADRGLGHGLDGGGHVQQGAGLLHHHQPVAGLEGSRQLRRHRGQTVPAEGDRHPGRQHVEQRGHGRVIRGSDALGNGVGPAFAQADQMKASLYSPYRRAPA
jgi:hypothetical protein